MKEESIRQEAVGNRKKRDNGKLTAVYARTYKVCSCGNATSRTEDGAGGRSGLRVPRQGNRFAASWLRQTLTFQFGISSFPKRADAILRRA